jgi:hypothetical protein
VGPVSSVFLPARVKVEDKTSLSKERDSYISIERDVFIKKNESSIVGGVVRKLVSRFCVKKHNSCLLRV